MLMCHVEMKLLIRTERPAHLTFHMTGCGFEDQGSISDKDRKLVSSSSLIDQASFVSILFHRYGRNFFREKLPGLKADHFFSFTSTLLFVSMW
jgi:hypothetical protein